MVPGHAGSSGNKPDEIAPVEGNHNVVIQNQDKGNTINITRTGSE